MEASRGRRLGAEGARRAAGAGDDGRARVVPARRRGARPGGRHRVAHRRDLRSLHARRRRMLPVLRRRRGRARENPQGLPVARGHDVLRRAGVQVDHLRLRVPDRPPGVRGPRARGPQGDRRGRVPGISGRRLRGAGRVDHRLRQGAVGVQRLARHPHLLLQAGGHEGQARQHRRRRRAGHAHLGVRRREEHRGRHRRRGDWSLLAHHRAYPRRGRRRARARHRAHRGEHRGRARRLGLRRRPRHLPGGGEPYPEGARRGRHGSEGARGGRRGRLERGLLQGRLQVSAPAGPPRRPYLQQAPGPPTRRAGCLLFSGLGARFCRTRRPRGRGRAAHGARPPRPRARFGERRRNPAGGRCLAVPEAG